LTCDIGHGIFDIGHEAWDIGYGTWNIKHGSIEKIRVAFVVIENNKTEHNVV